MWTLQINGSCTTASLNFNFRANNFSDTVISSLLSSGIRISLSQKIFFYVAPASSLLLILHWIRHAQDFRRGNILYFYFDVILEILLTERSHHRFSNDSVEGHKLELMSMLDLEEMLEISEMSLVVSSVKSSVIGNIESPLAVLGTTELKIFH